MDIEEIIKEYDDAILAKTDLHEIHRVSLLRSIRTTLTTYGLEQRAKEREVEKGRAIIVMNEFIESRGEDYPLGQYLKMLLVLNDALPASDIEQK